MYRWLSSIVFEYHDSGVLFFFITFNHFHMETSLFISSFFTSFCKKNFLKVRLLLDYSDLHKNLSKFHKIAILWSYCSHKFSPIPIKLLLFFVEIDHHIQYLWFMQLVWKFSVNDLLEASCILPPKECIPF